MLLPAVTLSLFKIALVIRLTEAGTRDVVQQEYVRFARAKGVSGPRLLARHIAPNVMIPVVTAVGLEFGHLIAFSVVTESVFAWPGMGKLIIDSILQLDRPVVVAYLMVTVLLIVCINLLVDFLYVVLDPRLRVQGQ
jgi:peptide/nickel transport system permease protein